ncbi:MAG: hypothetical protein Q4G05_06165, partial [Clostridia bacterium]|nr:hypothetical protein [Clostridia bacterium]
MEDSKVVFITHPYYAVNNPTNNFRIYKKAKNSNHWSYIQCKNKNEYRQKIKEYIGGFFDYGRNEEKAHISVKEYIKSDSSLFDYFMGGKKENSVMEENQMKREEMAMLKNGSFLLDKDVSAIQKRWSNYIENSNIQLAVLSFNQNYVDNNISVKELQKKIATDVMPKFLSYCGYENPKENLEWIVALHSDRENNYHFHISWVEKRKCYRNRYNQLENRVKLLLSDNENNFLKRQSILTIERKKLYTPALITLEKDFEELKTYFNPKDKNFTLKDIHNLKIEENIVKLGFLLNQIRTADKKYIKYNSLPNNEIGKKIKELTQLIKKDIFKDQRIQNSKQDIFDSINKINNILLDIDKRNNISNIGFESALENIMIQSKLEKSDNYVLNAIVNHALYNFEYQKRKINKSNFTVEDLINQVAYDNYLKD